MATTQTKGGLALTGVAMGVQERLGLCAALLQLRAVGHGDNDLFKKIRAEALLSRRVLGIRSQLLPNWRPAAAPAGTPAMAPARVNSMLGDALGKLALLDAPALKTEAGLKAADILQLSRLLEGEEIELGLLSKHADASELTGLIRAFTEAQEPEDTPEYMRGHTHAKASMYRAIDEGGYGAQVLEDARMAHEGIEYLSLGEFDPVAFAEMNAHMERSNDAAQQFYDLRDAPVKDTDQARQERANALQALMDEQRAIDAEYLRLSDALGARRSAAQDVQRLQVEQAKQRMQGLITQVAESSEVSEKDAKGWAQAIQITPEAEAALRKGGYPPTQVRKDAAEFFRFVRGRLDTVRILTHDSERAAANTPHGKPGQIFIPKSGKNFSKRVLWHELGHHIEADPSAAAAARLFIRMRSDAGQSDKLSKLTGWPGYEDEEIAFVDHFFSPYMGKIYAHGATEIFSMVLESYSDPALLAERLHKDPQSFAFVRGFIERPRDALEKLHLTMRQESRHVVDMVKDAKAKAVQAFEQRRVASAGFFADAADYLYGTPYSAVLAKHKAKPLGTMPGSREGQTVLLYTAKVVSETLVSVVGKNGKVKTKTVKEKVDGHWIAVVDGVLGQSVSVIRTLAFCTGRLNWVLAYLMRWSAEGFDGAKMPDVNEVSKDLQGMLL